MKEQGIRFIMKAGVEKISPSGMSLPLLVSYCAHIQNPILPRPVQSTSRVKTPFPQASSSWVQEFPQLPISSRNPDSLLKRTEVLLSTSTYESRASRTFTLLEISPITPNSPTSSSVESSTGMLLVTWYVFISFYFFR